MNSRLQSPAQLDEYRARQRAAHDPSRPCLNICGGTGCQASGADRLIAAANAAAVNAAIDGRDRLSIRVTGCPGFCEQGPIVVIQPEGIFYARVRPEDMAEIVFETVLGHRLVDRLLYTDPATGQKIPYERDIPFYTKQARLLLNQNGLVDPCEIDEYIAAGGYGSLVHALDLSPDQIVEAVLRSGLRGRGGAGFSTGLKWQTARRAMQKSGTGFLICNADEGDPGAFMDRALVEGNPHRILEGMIIGGYALGATHGYVYIRAEYPLAIDHLRVALTQARALGLLSQHILGSNLSFDVEIRLGAGAFVCGEETALMASIEGRAGDPRPRPPFPAERGLWGQPTVINNVKTWASVPIILDKGPEAYAAIGTEKSKGTMIFSLVGKVRNTGLVEVPMGITLRELIFGIGGGIPNGKAFKAAQIGGPSGGCIPAKHLDTSIDYESLTSLGAIMGSGGMVVTDEDTCMVDFARYFMNFVQEESCGKCVPCRLGTKAILDVLTRIAEGKAQPGDIEYPAELAEQVKSSSLCGLGQTAPNPILTTLRYFHDEYVEHVESHICRAHVCKGLIRYEIDPAACTGCLVCLRNCASNAIAGEKRKPHVIHAELCAKCGVCKELCKFNAVRVLTGNGRLSNYSTIQL
ncbi:MAG: NADH-quinone oxidoreductase subunit NuoF [Chloroflexi bacterium]|nr:NADH-quinone oxidoreductase subunit NuoF [Chloroflexota bacterium]